MKRILFPIIFAILLIGLILSGLRDVAVFVDDMANPNNHVASSMNEASNSPASAIITIMMYTLPNK